MLSLTEDRVEVWLRRYLIDAMRQTAKNNFIQTFIMRQHGPLKFYYITKATIIQMGIRSFTILIIQFVS